MVRSRTLATHFAASQTPNLQYVKHEDHEQLVHYRNERKRTSFLYDIKQDHYCYNKLV